MNQRRTALDNFKQGKTKILIATDIAARGIDVKRIELVVNYDIPSVPEDYVHRIGRTGRAGEVGEAITFVTPEQTNEIRRIERVIGRRLNQTKVDGSVIPPKPEAATRPGPAAAPATNPRPQRPQARRKFRPSFPPAKSTRSRAAR
jgi:ATP-dependent RNA helicase RhlE